MKSILFFFFLILNIFLIQSIQTDQKTISSVISSIETERLTGTTRYYSTPDEAWFWSLFDTIIGPPYFGSSVSVYKDVLVVGDDHENQAFIYRYNGTNFNLEQNFSTPTDTGFGISVSVYENVTVIGAYYANQVFIYRYNGTYWNEEKFLNEVITNFGWSVSIHGNVTAIGTDEGRQVFIYRYNGTDWNLDQNINEGSVFSFGISVSVYDNVTVVGASGSDQAYIYRYDGSIWNQEQVLSGPGWSDFGISVSVDGDVLVVGADSGEQAFIYRYNEANWNEEQILTGPSSSSFGWSVSVYGDVIGVGAYDTKQAFVYRYNGTIWNEEQNLTQSSSDFGISVSIYGNFTVVGTQWTNKAFVYEAFLIPQVNIVNCSSLFSSFDCYWDEIQIPNLIYQINYGYDWIDIDSPILEDGNVYYQQFNSSTYDNITGNEYYPIQIKACGNATMICGEPSSFVNLTTKIDSVNDFQLSNPSNYSINVTWNYPNVQINGGIAHLDHYNLSYLTQSQPDLISFISVDNSSLDYLLNNLECGNDYNISICGCRTHECEGDDKGEIVESSISLIFGEVTSLTCSISNTIDINCNWNQPINCSIPSYYNFTYQSISQNDSGNYQPTSTNQQFTAQFPNQEYQINVSACDSNDKCGYISTISVTTDNLTAPTIYETISKIEEIEFNFTKLTNANNYSISLDNGTNWQKFTSLDLSGNEAIGIISGISGNIEYNISIRGCVDLNCETPYLGLPSSINPTRAKLGNITSLNCSSLINGFECSWDSLILSSGLKAYSFNYNSTSICLTNLTTDYSVTGLQGEEYYEISIYSSADLNCSFNEYSGINSTTSITTDILPAPTIYETISKIEEIEFNFTKLTNANNYSISLDNGTNWQKFTSLDLSGNEVIGIISGISGNIEYNISIRGCSDLNCETPCLGLPSSINPARAKLGNITSLNCSSLINGFECSWDSLILSSGLKAYSFNYNSTSICLTNLTTDYSVTGLQGEEYYEISIYSSADLNCSFNEYSGINSTTSITTDILPAPTIYETISKIEEIEFNFTKLTNANNYSISLDNGTNWQKFTSLDLSGNEAIGTISGISGNIEYNISIRGCSDLNCETPCLGLPSSINPTRAKLGNITSLNCNSLINGFECSWNSLILSSGLKAYSFNYNSTSICLTNLTTDYSVTGLQGGEYYEISIYSSADLNCSFNEYSGINSTTSITISSPNQASDNSTNTTAIALGVVIPILVISAIIIGVILYKKKKRNKSKNPRKKIKEAQELELDLDI
ncbi:hypothetical protein M0811_12305 [Anaeramoeba ignava]|uniref:Fibronectin type-III domain-containing protein n=1 Tax=Anaeramoeba ignava TaxID=1746090 RepID=A0A9Q0L8S8_ANAIG|nr:hypothetical protein M0811_12305 [Anaeramoeba ignava]